MIEVKIWDKQLQYDDTKEMMCTLSPMQRFTQLKEWTILQAQIEELRKKMQIIIACNATLGRRGKEALTNYGRHTQKHAANTAENQLSSRRTDYRKVGQRSSIGSNTLHGGASPSEVFVQQPRTKYTKHTSRVTQGRVTSLCWGPIGSGSPRSNFD